MWKPGRPYGKGGSGGICRKFVGKVTKEDEDEDGGYWKREMG